MRKYNGLEINRLMLEINRLKKWYKDPRFWSFGITVSAAIVTVVVTFTTGLFEARTTILNSEKIKIEEARGEYNAIKDSLINMNDILLREQGNLRTEKETNEKLLLESMDINTELNYWKKSYNQLKILTLEQRRNDEALGVTSDRKLYTNIKKKLNYSKKVDLQENIIEQAFYAAKRYKNILDKHKYNLAGLATDIAIEPHYEYHCSSMSWGSLLIQDEEINKIITELYENAYGINLGRMEYHLYMEDLEIQKMVIENLEIGSRSYVKNYTDLKQLINKKYPTIDTEKPIPYKNKQMFGFNKEIL